MLNKTSKLWKLNKVDFQKLVDDSSSYKEIIDKLNIVKTGDYYKLLYDRINKEDIDISKFEKNKKNNKRDITKRNLKELMIENSTYNRKSLKRRIIEENLIEEKCNICNIPPIWNNSKLILVLDHINGINNDHRLENLQLLCPNCNSQTKTFSGKNQKIKAIENSCIDCNSKIVKRSKRCIQCYHNNRSKSN